MLLSHVSEQVFDALRDGSHGPVTLTVKKTMIGDVTRSKFNVKTLTCQKVAKTILSRMENRHQRKTTGFHRLSREVQAMKAPKTLYLRIAFEVSVAPVALPKTQEDPLVQVCQP